MSNKTLTAEQKQDQSNIIIELPELKQEQVPKCKSKNIQAGNSKFIYLIPFLIVNLTCTFLDDNGSTLALPFMQTDFGVSKSVAQWIMTIFYLAQAAASIPLAKIGENYGQVKVLVVFQLILVVCDTGLFFIQNFYVFCAIRLITGAFTAGCGACKNSLLRKMAPADKQQQFILYGMIVFQLMNVVIPFVNSIIVTYNWRLIFAISAIGAMLSIVTLIPYTNPPTVKHKLTFDYWGTAVLFFGVSALDLGFTLLSYKAWLSCGILVAAGLVLLFCFYRIEKKAKDPVLPLKLMRNPVGALAITYILQSFQFGGVYYLLPQTFAFYKQDQLRVGSILTLVSVAAFVLSLVMPIISKRIINKTIALFGFYLNLAVFVCFVVFSSSLLAFSILIIFYQFIFSISILVIFPLIQLSVPKQYTSQISAVPNTARTVGNGLTMCATSMLLQLVFNQYKQNDFDQEAYSLALRCCFVMFLALQVVTIILFQSCAGQSSIEKNKKGFRKDKVRELQLDEDKQEGELLMEVLKK